MKYVDDYRNSEISKNILKKIHEEFSYDVIKRKINIMEVCVTSKEFIDDAIKLSENEKIIICIFADMLKVPGSKESLRSSQNKKNNIRIIYSPLDCLKICEANYDKEIVLLGVGFETTTPIIGLTSFSLYRLHKI